MQSWFCYQNYFDQKYDRIIFIAIIFFIQNRQHSSFLWNEIKNIVFHILDVGTLLAFDNENFITTCKFDDGQYLKKQTLRIIIFIEMIEA